MYTVLERLYIVYKQFKEDVMLDNQCSEKNQPEKNQPEKIFDHECKHITCHSRQEARRIGGRYYDKVLERFVCMGGCEDK